MWSDVFFIKKFPCFFGGCKSDRATGYVQWIVIRSVGEGAASRERG